MKIRVLVAVLGVVVAILVGPTPAHAVSYSVDVTCRLRTNADLNGNQQGLPNFVRLTQLMHTGDTVDVHYHDCLWLFVDHDVFGLATAGIGVLDDLPEGFREPPYLLPARDGVATLVAVSEPTGNDMVADLYQGPDTRLSDLVLNAYRPRPQFTVTAKRDPRKCTRITVTLQGIPASANITVDPVLSYGGHTASTGYDGTGGDGGAWTHTFSFARTNYPVPRGPVRLGVQLQGDYFNGVDTSRRAIEGFTRVAACG